jgi:signal transduction histidine kinase
MGFGTATDISERKKLEQEREQLLAREQEARAEADRRHEELQRVTESRAALIRGFSHDVRNPLSVADMSAQL